MKFPVLAFDLDGTLYPNYRLYARLIPFMVKENRLLRAMGKARAHFRETDGPGGNYYENQARFMAEILGEPVETVMEKTERLIYRGWEPHFNKIKLFPRVRETLEAFRNSGVKLGLLSDFPPEIKLENLNVPEFWDAIVCSERVGYLKPNSASFLELAGKMGTAPEKTLYVGNSVSYDVGGAGRAGMKAALIRSRWKRRPAAAGQDFVFYDYRQLCDFVLH